jgi:hypothetical protein
MAPRLIRIVGSQRSVFNSVPKKASEIIEDELISLKIIVLSIGPLRLKNKKNMKFFGKKKTYYCFRYKAKIRIKNKKYIIVVLK